MNPIFKPRVRKKNFRSAAAILICGILICGREISRAAPTSSEFHPLKTKTLVIMARGGAGADTTTPTRPFDKNFAIRVIDAGKIAEQLRGVLTQGAKEDYRAFWLVATGQVASRVINEQDILANALSSAGAENYKIILLDPDEQAVDVRSLASLVGKPFFIVESKTTERPEYREAISQFKARHGDGILAWIEARGTYSATPAFDELSNEELFKVARVATGALGPKSLPAKKDTATSGRGLETADYPPLIPSAYETAIAEVIANHPQQKRAEMVYCPYLNLVARAKALDMARRGYFNHVDPDGFGPNHVIRSLGYALPDRYNTARKGNSVESIFGIRTSSPGATGRYSRGDANPVADEVVQSWMTSIPHRKHLLGYDERSRSQTRYGIGYAVSRAGARGRPLAVTVAFISAPPSLTELAPLNGKVVDDYLTRTPAQRQRRAKNQPLAKAIEPKQPLPDKPPAKSIPPADGSIRDSFEGQWHTNWGMLVIRQKGNEVTGTYSGQFSGSIEGKIVDGTLLYTWKQPGGEWGSGVFCLTDGGNSIKGTWGQENSAEGGKWNGKRVSPQQ